VITQIYHRFFDEDKTLVCPLYITRFELETRISHNPFTGITLKIYEWKIEEGDIYI
jgi:nitrite reductase/ring-hydroxylating ferredoxin subunit